MRPLKVLLAVLVGMLAFTASVSFLPPSLFAALPANLNDRFMAVFGDAGGGATYLRVQATTNAAGALPANLNDRWYAAFVDAGSGTTALNVVCTGCGGGGTPAGATGAVQFNNAGAFGGDAANFFYDSANASLRLGALGLGVSETELQIQSAGGSGNAAVRLVTANASLSSLELYASRGTIASPTAVTVGDSLGTVEFFGRHTGGFWPETAYIQASV